MPRIVVDLPFDARHCSRCPCLDWTSRVFENATPSCILFESEGNATRLTKLVYPDNTMDAERCEACALAQAAAEVVRP